MQKGCKQNLKGFLVNHALIFFLIVRSLLCNNFLSFFSTEKYSLLWHLFNMAFFCFSSQKGCKRHLKGLLVNHALIFLNLFNSSSCYFSNSRVYFLLLLRYRNFGCKVDQKTFSNQHKKFKSKLLGKSALIYKTSMDFFLLSSKYAFFSIIFHVFCKNHPRQYGAVYELCRLKGGGGKVINTNKYQVL